MSTQQSKGTFTAPFVGTVGVTQRTGQMPVATGFDFTLPHGATVANEQVLTLTNTAYVAGKKSVITGYVLFSDAVHGDRLAFATFLAFTPKSGGAQVSLHVADCDQQTAAVLPEIVLFDSGAMATISGGGYFIAP